VSINLRFLRESLRDFPQDEAMDQVIKTPKKRGRPPKKKLVPTAAQPDTPREAEVLAGDDSPNSKRRSIIQASKVDNTEPNQGKPTPEEYARPSEPPSIPCEGEAISPIQLTHDTGPVVAEDIRPRKRLRVEYYEVPSPTPLPTLAHSQPPLGDINFSADSQAALSPYPLLQRSTKPSNPENPIPMFTSPVVESTNDLSAPESPFFHSDSRLPPVIIDPDVLESLQSFDLEVAEALEEVQGGTSSMRPEKDEITKAHIAEQPVSV